MRGRITRREFTGRMTAAGLSATAISGLLLNKAKAETPKKGGKITVGCEGNAKETLEPGTFQSVAAVNTGFAVYDPLTSRGADLRPEPWSAESWDSNTDASEWIFKLRKDVTFHDGKKFGADDIVYSYWRIIAPESENPAKSMLAHVQEVKKDDDHTVKFVLSSPDADFPVACGDHRSQVVQDGWTEFSHTTSGTGPFRIKEFNPGINYLLERNDDYWGDDGPWLDEIEYLSMGDVTARINALLSGEIQVLGGLDPKAVDLIERRDDVAVMTIESSTQINLVMTLDQAPTDNPDLRLALKYGLDRERIVNNVFKGLAHVGNDHPISPIDPFYCDEIPQRPYDPDKARFHIKKAGMENVPVDLYTSDAAFAGAESATVVYQESAAAGGINLNVIRSPADSYWDVVWMVKPFVVSNWDSRPTANILFSTVLWGDAPWNESHWRNERFDQLLVEARATTDFDKRKAMYCEMQQMVQDDGGHSVMAFMNYTDARRSEVRGITPHPGGPLGFFKMARTAWLDS